MREKDKERERPRRPDWGRGSEVETCRGWALQNLAGEVALSLRGA